jgi:hypothetical protein
VPPPREPRHQKAIKSAINSWVISTLGLSWSKEDAINIGTMINEEKTSLVRLARVLYYNFQSRWFYISEDSLIISIK